MVLPLITNMLPQQAASQTSAQAANQSSILAGLSDGSAAGRQQLANAVIATGAPAAFSPNTPQQRQTNITARTPTEIRDEQAAILPDPRIWQTSERAPAPQVPVPARALPQITLTQVSQFTAQMMAQELPAPPTESAEESITLRRPWAVAPKKPGIGEARGTKAYDVAVQRNFGTVFPVSHEELS
jgi:hypothetical protein